MRFVRIFGEGHQLLNFSLCMQDLSLEHYDTFPAGGDCQVPVKKTRTKKEKKPRPIKWHEESVLDRPEIAQAVTSKHKWQHGTKKTVRFLTNHPQVEVHFVSSQDPSLQTILTDMVDGNPMALDLEWFCWVKPQVINCYQICSTRGVVVIHDIHPEPNKIIRDFLSAESGNKFVAKGCSCDYRMLLDRFGPTFRIYMEDVHVTRLAPNKLPVNFEKMVEMFAGPSTAPFKNKKVSRSNWSATELTVQQVLYAAFDAFSLYQCIPNFPPVSGDPYSRSIPNKLRQVMGVGNSEPQPVRDDEQKPETVTARPKRNRRRKKANAQYITPRQIPIVAQVTEISEEKEAPMLRVEHHTKKRKLPKQIPMQIASAL